MKKALYHIAISILVLAASCTKEIQVNPKDYSKKLVVTSSLNSDSLFSLVLSTTNSISSKSSFSSVEDGIVKIYENGNLLGNFVHEANGKYTLAIKPKRNNEYFIDIEAGELSCTALDIVPDTVKVVSLRLDTVPFLSGQDFLQFTLEPSNDLGKKEYYEVSANLVVREYKVFSGVKVDSVDVTRVMHLETIDPVILSNANNKNFNEQYLFSDELLESRSSVKFGTYDVKNLKQNEMIVSCTIKLKSLSENSFRYYNSLYSQIYYRSDPFSLPVKVETNVVNGYGIFGGIQEDHVDIQF